MINFVSSLPLLWLPPLPLEIPAEFQGTFASNPAACEHIGDGTRILVTSHSWRLGDTSHPIIAGIRVSPEVLVLRYGPIVTAQPTRLGGEITSPAPQGPTVEMVALIAIAPNQLRILFETNESALESRMGGLLVTRCEQ